MSAVFIMTGWLRHLVEHNDHCRDVQTAHASNFHTRTEGDVATATNDPEIGFCPVVTPQNQAARILESRARGPQVYSPEEESNPSPADASSQSPHHLLCAMEEWPKKTTSSKVNQCQGYNFPIRVVLGQALDRALGIMLDAWPLVNVKQQTHCLILPGEWNPPYLFPGANDQCFIMNVLSVVSTIQSQQRKDVKAAVASSFVRIFFCEKR